MSLQAKILLTLTLLFSLLDQAYANKPQHGGPPPRPEFSSIDVNEDGSIDFTEFDADNLSESDAISIVETLSNAGIQPSKTLADAMDELGFDAKAIGDLANQKPQGNRPPPPQNSEDIGLIGEYLNQLVDEKLTASELYPCPFKMQVSEPSKDIEFKAH